MNYWFLYISGFQFWFPIHDSASNYKVSIHKFSYHHIFKSWKWFAAIFTKSNITKFSKQIFQISRNSTLPDYLEINNYQTTWKSHIPDITNQTNIPDINIFQISKYSRQIFQISKYSRLNWRSIYQTTGFPNIPDFQIIKSQQQTSNDMLTWFSNQQLWDKFISKYPKHQVYSNKLTLNYQTHWFPNVIPNVQQQLISKH